ncbi:hypothetical protein N9R54_02950 [Pelobium sp.]|nr:hypothetical protein [Pelobium sp.]MDA9555174.1 hypothetical protein [Pelobium sp.]
MDLQEIWKDFKPKTDEVTDITNTNQLHHSIGFENPLKKLKKLLKANIIWGILITLVLVPTIIYAQYWPIHAFLSIVVLFTIWGVFKAIILYKDINPDVTGNNLLSELIRNKDAINKWMRVQRKVALAVYPFSAAGGFMLGGVVGSGKTLEQFMSKPSMYWALIISIIVLTPLCDLLTKWMFNYSFGKVLHKIDQLIEELSEV